MGKQMEGDEDMKRKRAREARDAGKAPSEAGVTTGASKQRRHKSSGEHDDRLESVQHGEQKSAGDDVPRPLRGKGRQEEPRTGAGSSAD